MDLRYHMFVAVINSMFNLKNLESLNIGLQENGIVTKSFFHHISLNLLKLKNLDLCFSKVTDNQIHPISKLPNLEVLMLEGVHSISGSGLASLSNLKELHCYCCKNLKNEHLIKLLYCAKYLELLDIRHCKKITNSVLNFAIEETKKRRNNIVLKMKIFHTRINVAEISEKSPLLHLIIENSELL